jgi:hypothetical protein
LFWSLFEASIHGQRKLTAVEVEKFTYLVSQVEGSDRATIAGLQITEDNYVVAVQLLKDRYERSSACMVAELYTELKRLPMSGTSVPDKRRVLDDCECIFRQLEQTGQSVDNNQSLVIDFLSKFPPSMVRELDQLWNVGIESSLGEARRQIRLYVDKAEKVNETVDKLRSITLASAGERSKSTRSQNWSDDGHDGFGNQQYTGPRYSELGNEYQKPSSAFFATKGAGKDSRDMGAPRRFCGLCGERSHFTCHCSAYPTLESRLKLLRESKRCERCMSSKHMTNMCQTVIRLCFYCKGYHVSPLCPKEYIWHVFWFKGNERCSGLFCCCTEREQTAASAGWGRYRWIRRWRCFVVQQ